MREKIKKHKLLTAIILVLFVGIVVFVTMMLAGQKKVSADEVQQGENTISLEKMDLTKSISATGTIQSQASKMVSANVNNITVKNVKVSVGDEVKKGDELLVFDESDLQQALQDATDNLSAVKEETNRNIESANKQLSDAKETYTSEKKQSSQRVASAKEEKQTAAKQVSDLKKRIAAEKNASTKVQLEEQLAKAEETLKQAESSYESAVSEQENSNKQNKSNIENATDAVATAKSNQTKSVKEAQKQVDEASDNLSECSVTAPISGIVTAASVEEGDTYSGGDMFQIDDNSGYTVSTTVDEYDISNVEVGQRVVILTEATDEDELEGEITFVAPSTGSTSISSSSSQSGESSGMSSSTTSTEGYEILIELKTKDERLKMGLTAKCSIILEDAKDVYAVPYDAIHENTDGTTVIYVTDSAKDTSSKREVVVTQGMESDYYVEISGEELSDGLQVIIPTDAASTTDSSSGDEGLGILGGVTGGRSGASSNKRFSGGGMGAAPGM